MIIFETLSISVDIYEEKKGDINMQILLDIIQIILNIVTIVCLVKLINK